MTTVGNTPRAPARSSAELTIDLGAIAANYALLKAKAAPATCSAVVKADAYGLGLEPVARALGEAGCRHFFVAHPGEGAELRAIASERLRAAEVYVLTGLAGESPAALRAHDLTPVLSTVGDIKAWGAQASREARKLPAILNVDTGMNRLGLGPHEIGLLTADMVEHIDVRFAMSHYACADDLRSARNEEQLRRFEVLRAQLPLARGATSLANSSGIFLGATFHGDLVRPGMALYGLNPTSGDNPMRIAVTLEAPVLQVRSIDKGESIGYGATFTAPEPMRVATIGAGYADGIPRALGNQGHFFVGDVKVPIVGRVSMDLITLDVSRLSPDAVQPGTPVELLGPHRPADDVAREAGTIGYEILTRLGQRYPRSYRRT